MDRFVYRQKIKRTLSFLRERWHMKSFAGSGIATFQHLPLGSDTQISQSFVCPFCLVTKAELDLQEVL